jgi:large subunit ribosomal protein L10
LAISKERKNELVTQYGEWLNHSQALFVTEYKGLSVKQIEELRRKAREIGGEFHVIKNTLAKRALASAGLTPPEGLFEGSTAIGFAFSDAAAMAKLIMEFMRTNEFIKVKGGYLGRQPMSADEVKALAELPPLPVMRAQLMGTLLAPASQLARLLASPDGVWRL